MKVAVLVVLTWMFACQVAGQDAPPDIKLPFPTARMPESAMNAGEAPRWSPPAQHVQHVAAAQQAPPAVQQTPPAVQQAIQAAQSPSSAAAWPAPPAQDPSAQSTEPAMLPDEHAEGTRPIQSIMKSRTSSVGSPSGVVPAQFNAPIPEGALDAPLPQAQPSPPSLTVPSLGSRYDAQPPAVTSPALTVPPATAAPAEPARLSAPIAEPAEPPARQEELPPPTSESAAESAAKAAARAATDLLASSLPDETPAAAVDRPLPLIEVLAVAPQGSDVSRLAAIRGYWRLSRAMSAHQWAQEELKRLEQIVPSRGSVDSPMLSTARAAATARMHDAELELRSAQEALASVGAWQPGQLTSGTAPADHPLVGPYLTYFDTLFVERPAPARARQINRCLPLRLSVINDRAAAVQSATSAVHFAEEAHARGETTLSTVLDCHEELFKQRRAFLEAVEQYNNDIGEYAVIVAGPSAPVERLVSMLIRAKQPETSPAARMPAQASAPSATTRGATRSSSTGSSDGWTASPPRAAGQSPTPARGTAPAGSASDF